MDAHTLKVGDTLWWVPDRGEPSEVVVKKVGRKWATVGKPAWGVGMNERIDYLNPQMPAGGGMYLSPGRCWRTKEEYDLYCQRNKLWFDLRAYFSSRDAHRVPAHLDVDDLESILQALRGGDDGP